MANLTQIRSALSAGLTGLTGVPMWDYWASAPDEDFPIVGLVWPSTIAPMGSHSVYSFEASAAVWANDPAQLWSSLSSIVNALETLGPNGPCLSSLASVGLSAELDGPIRVGLPNSSAASSTGPEMTGVWVAINFTLRLQ